jgi:imidazole glycerol-phosphate synthase subunit HisH
VNKVIIGVLDYGAGNCASVRSSINIIGLRSKLVKTKEDFLGIDVLIIPGVGAFQSAMNSLITMRLVEPIRQFAHQGNPVIGICLGMQLLADVSYEHGCTRGLELIPGEVKQLSSYPGWHIGWNTLEIIQRDSSINDIEGDSFYFNHSFEFIAPTEYVTGIARAGRSIVAMVRKDNVCGFQFHPEKSQLAGVALIKKTIQEMLHA